MNNYTSALRGSHEHAHRNLRRSLITCASIIGFMCLSLQTATAATTDEAATGESALPVLKEVVVTARKKSENLQNVPLSITAISSETLTQASAISLEDIAFLTPGVTYNSNGAQYNSSPVIRGLSDTSGGLASSQNVSIFLDGVYIADPSAIDLSLGGLDRVEVIEGPVSGLYGRNAFTGAINYVTAAPTQAPHADLAVTAGDYGRNIVEGVGSTAIIKNVLSARLAYTYNHIDGTYQDSVSGLRSNGYNRNDALLSFLYTPDSHIRVSPVLYYGDDTFGAPTQVLYPDNCGLTTTITYCGKLGGGYIGPNTPYESGTDASGNSRRVEHAHIDGKLSYEWGTLDLLAGFNHIQTKNIVEFTGTEYGIPYDLYAAGKNGFGAAPLPGAPVLAKSFFGTGLMERDASFEFRYDTPSQYPIRFGLGGYYFRNVTNAIDTFGIDGQNIPAADVFNIVAQGYVTPNGASNHDINTGKDGTIDYSYVANGEWDILPTLTLSSTVRATEEEKTQVNSSSPPGGLEKDYHSITSNEALNWKPSKTLTLYVSAANGEKAGGFNFAAQGPADYSYQPETDWDYEAGVKSTLLDGHLRLNGDVFYTTLTNLISAAPPSTAGAIATVAKNVGSLSGEGVEVKADWVVTDALTLSAGLAANNPRFDSGSYDVSNAGACAVIAACESRLTTYKGAPAVNVKGLAPPNESDFTFNFTAQYKRPLGYKDFDWFVRGDYRFESKEYQGVENLAWYGPRNVINGHIGVQNKSWTLTAYVLNVLNDKTPIGAVYNAQLNTFDVPPNGFIGVNWNQLADLPDPRTFAVRIAYHY
jgi:iron complex outermembrane receptor protein